MPARPALQRVLVVLPNWVGDTLLATPVLRVVRQAHPRAFLATFGAPVCREVLAGNPHLDAQLVYDERGADRSLRARFALLRALRAQRFDTAFLLRRSLSRTLLLWLAGIRARVGYDEGRGRWLLTHRMPPPVTPVHRAEQYLGLVRALGMTAAVDGCDFVVAADQQQRMDQWLARVRPAGDRRTLVALNTGANWPHKRWPEERFAALAQRVQRELDAAVVLTGGPRDGALAQRIAAGVVPPPLSAAGVTTSLQELGALFRRCAVVVSNDSGPMHVAAGLRVPLVALFGPTAPSLTGPYGRGPWTVLHHPDCCPQVPCYHAGPPAHPGMASITVDEVFDAVAARLQQR